MSFPWELITAVADSVIVSLLYVAFKEAEKTAQQIQGAPFYKVGKELEEALEAAPDNVLPYVCISGKVEPRGKALSSHYHDQQGVIQRLTLTEHSTKRSQGFWTDCRRVIHQTLNVTPFSMVADDDSLKSVLVCEPLTAEYLMDDLQTTYDKFNPNQSGFMERGIDRLFGDVSKGFQETEKMLPTEAYIIGFGRLALLRGDMQLMPPDEGFRYILSRLSQTELVKYYRTHASRMKGLAIIFGAIGGLIIGIWAVKIWDKYLERREADRALQEMRERRTATRGNDEEGEATGTECVICISNPREVIVLDCGHVCMCAECARLLPSPRYCPICRNPVSRVQPIYIA